MHRLTRCKVKKDFPKPSATNTQQKYQQPTTKKKKEGESRKATRSFCPLVSTDVLKKHFHYANKTKL